MRGRGRFDGGGVRGRGSGESVGGRVVRRDMGGEDDVQVGLAEAARSSESASGLPEWQQEGSRCTLKLYFPVPWILPLEHPLELETEALGIPKHRGGEEHESAPSPSPLARARTHLMTELVVSFLSVVRAWPAGRERCCMVAVVSRVGLFVLQRERARGVGGGVTRRLSSLAWR